MKDNSTESSVYFRLLVFSRDGNLRNQNAILIDFQLSNSGTFLEYWYTKMASRGRMSQPGQ